MKYARLVLLYVELPLYTEEEYREAISDKIREEYHFNPDKSTYANQGN